MAENNIQYETPSNTEKDFTQVQTVYGISLVLGLENVAESIFITLINILYTNDIVSEFHIFNMRDENLIIS